MTFTPYLPSMPLAEPLIAGMVQLLSTELPAVVATANLDLPDSFTIPLPAQYLDFFPSEAELQGGMPIVAVGESTEGAVFVDDLQSTVDSVYEYAVGIIHQEADHETLVKNLRRLSVCVAYTIQADRLLGPHGIMRGIGAFSVNFLRAEPGPMVPMGPLDSGQPPHAWLSWSSFIMSSRHNEQV